MGYETYRFRKYGNTGVTLFNVEGMRRTYNLLMEIAFADEWVEQGLHFREKGPLDQGAVNLVYIGTHKKNVVSPKIFNWRPYWAVPHFYKSSIIHFHGPNPLDYQRYFDRSSESIYLPEYKAIFERCEDPNAGGACRIWVSKWITMLNRIQNGFTPEFKSIYMK